MHISYQFILDNYYIWFIFFISSNFSKSFINFSISTLAPTSPPITHHLQLPLNTTTPTPFITKVKGTWCLYRNRCPNLLPRLSPSSRDPKVKWYPKVKWFPRVKRSPWWNQTLSPPYRFVLDYALPSNNVIHVCFYLNSWIICKSPCILD